MYNNIYSKDLQRNYKKILDGVRENIHIPYLVYKRNKPLAAIVSLNLLEEYNEMKRIKEISAALAVINEGEKEYKEGRAKKVEELTKLL